MNVSLYKAWRHDVVEKRDFETDLFDRYWAKKKCLGSHWHQFQEAVIWYRDMALETLKSLYEKVGLPI